MTHALQLSLLDDHLQLGSGMGGVDPNPVGKEPGFTEDDREAQRRSAWTYRAVVATMALGTMGLVDVVIMRQLSSHGLSGPVLARAKRQQFIGISAIRPTNMLAAGALYDGTGYVIDRYRGKNDKYNSVSAGFIAASFLTRNAGPQAALSQGLFFAVFTYLNETFYPVYPYD
ncbi:hypothetical protein BDZ89DRAFT_1049116 [Hymenopellis radicata]|nr:hypothetical protein BDZ89DRAFT_1049116 [Hymenopellis radicata]